MIITRRNMEYFLSPLICGFQEATNTLSHPKNHPPKIACFNSVYFHIHIHRSMTFFKIANVSFFAYGHYVNGLLIIRQLQSFFYFFWFETGHGYSSDI